MHPDEQNDAAEPRPMQDRAFKVVPAGAPSGPANAPPLMDAAVRPLRLVIFTHDPTHGSRLSDVLASRNRADEMLVRQGDLSNLAIAIEETAPELAIIEGFDRHPGLLHAIEQLAIRNPQLPVTLVSQNLGPDFLMNAMRAGVREIVPGRGSSMPLFESIDRVRRRLVAATGNRQRAKLISFISCKGGSGTTFLATNFAHALATQERKRVLLIDLNLPFGEAEIYVTDRRATHSLADVAAEIERLDSSLLASMVVQVTPTFSILAAPEEPERAVGVKPEHVERLLAVAANDYDVVILDVNGSLDPLAIMALDHSDLVMVVMQDSLPFVRSAKRMHGVFRNLGYPASKIQFVINRHDPRSEIGRSAIERTLGLRVSHVIPNSFRTVNTAVNQGIPAVDVNRKDPAVRALQEMARQLVASLATRRVST